MIKIYLRLLSMLLGVLFVFWVVKFLLTKDVAAFQWAVLVGVGNVMTDMQLKDD